MKRFSIGEWRGGKLTRGGGGRFQSKIENARAFSLVEVTLALGIVSFALVSVLGLLPVGLRSIKNANEQAGAANVLNAIAASLRAATASPGNPADYASGFSGKPITYSVGSTATNEISWEDLNLDGSAATAQSPKRLSAILNITAPASLTAPGNAVISVAWSAQANPVWDGTMQTWTKADGSITSGIQFLPRQ